jgi:hypothetical protein
VTITTTNTNRSTWWPNLTHVISNLAVGNHTWTVTGCNPYHNCTFGISQRSFMIIGQTPLIIVPADTDEDLVYLIIVAGILVLFVLWLRKKMRGTR